MVVVTFTDSEAEYLRDILDWWLDDHEEANQQTAKDRTFATPEEMLSAVESMKEQQSAALSIRDSLSLVGKEA